MLPIQIKNELQKNRLIYFEKKKNFARDFSEFNFINDRIRIRNTELVFNLLKVVYVDFDGIPEDATANLKNDIQ